MISSRLRKFRALKTVKIQTKTLASGQYTESSLLANLKATHYPKGGDEAITDGGVVVVVTDVFWFDKEDCPGRVLPAITESHVIVDQATDVRYEVVSNPVDQAGGGNRLKVVTKRIR